MLQFFYKMRKNKKGFTLIELIVVIAILAILAMLAIPRLSGFTESARKATDQELASVIANAGAMQVATMGSHAVVDDATKADAFLTEMDSSDLIDAAQNTEAKLEGLLESTFYKGVSVRYNGTNVTVRLQLVNGTDDDTGTDGVDADFVVTK